MLTQFQFNSSLSRGMNRALGVDWGRRSNSLENERAFLEAFLSVGGAWTMLSVVKGNRSVTSIMSQFLVILCQIGA